MPDSLENVGRFAFSFDILGSQKPDSVITLHMSGKLARYLEEHNDHPRLAPVYAKAYIIDGKEYARIGDYAKQAKEEQRQREAEERERREKARREREEAERKAAEARKAAERERINREIASLRAEMDGLRGLFAGLKRRKLQKQIDELNEQLRRL